MGPESDSRRRVLLGRVSGVFGVRGWVKVYSYTSPPEGILDYSPWLLETGSGCRQFEVAEGRRHGKGLIASLEGVEDRTGAAALVGLDIGVPRDALPAPEKGSYYWADLEGLEVRDASNNVLGRVDYLLETGANDVLVVKGSREVLIPFVLGSVVKDVDLTRGVIVVDWEWE